MKTLRKILHYLLPSIVFLFLVLFYLVYTDSGNKTAYSLMSYYASKKAGLDIEVQEIDFKQYPHLKAKIRIEELYKVDIDGSIANKRLNLDYILTSQCLKSNLCRFDDIIRIEGKILGWPKDFLITGQGKTLDGNVTYTFRKLKHTFKDVKLQLHDINSTKLLTMLDQKVLFKGKANVLLDFKIIQKDHKIGKLIYDVDDKSFYHMDTHFHALVDVVDNTHTFTMDLNTSGTQVHISDGVYDLETRHAHANYQVDTADVSKLKTLIGGSYSGEFHAKGVLEYDKKEITIKGLSRDFGGELSFVYKNHMVELFLKNISFERVMQRIGTTPLLHANITGTGTYDLQEKSMHLDTKLRETRLLSSTIVDSIQKKFHYNLANERFDQSSFSLIYKDKHIVSSNFILANNNAYLKLQNTQINAAHNAIDTTIDLKTPKHTLAGKLHARIDNLGSKTLDELYINYNGIVEKYYHVTLDGLMSHHFINMDYTLNAARLPSHICTIVDDINLTGHASGSFERLHIRAEGMAMEGNVSFNAIKIKDHLEDVSLNLEEIHTLKLFTLLGLPDLPNGKADINASFSHMSRYHTSGALDYNLSQGVYKTLPLRLEAHATVNKNLIHYHANARLSTADIHLSRGIYDLDNNVSQAFYTFSTNNLLPLKPLIGSYRGAFSATGELNYKEQIQLRGISPSFGGMVDFLYKENMLYIDLENISLNRLMGLFPYPHIIDAQVKGNINYDYHKEKLLVDTHLLNTRFLDSTLVQTIYKQSGVDMTKEHFDPSNFRATYENSIFVGDLMLQSKESHFYLSKVHIDKKSDRVNGFFDLKMQGEAFSGKVYGDLKHPKIDLNMKKLLRYQMDKQLDSVMGKSNRKLMEAIPMEGVAKDMATEIGGGLLDMFF